MFSVLPLFLFLLLSLPHPCLATSVSLAWDPSPDTDIAGYRVYYQANSSGLPFQGTGAAEGNAPVDGGTLTVASISGLDPANSYYFAVTAYNSAGTESVYSNIVQVPETLPPLVSVTSPAENTPVATNLVICAAAADNVGIAKVQFLVNGAQVHETSAAPYTYTWNAAALPAGSYAISARAVDLSGNEAVSKAVNVSVVGDAISPTVSLAVPPSDAKVGGTISVSASASDNLGVSRLELSIDGTLLLSSNQNPVSYVWNTASFANGTHVISVRAYDAAGNSGVASATVLVDNGTGQTDSTPPPASTSTSTSTATSPLTLADAQFALQIASGQQGPTLDQMQRLDVAPYVNGQPQPNGKVDTGDVVVILAKLTGKL
ncbi:fibronectin type III domain-containing protein [Geomonas subterranea]|uniref:Fibronectin type III domain-containing protein n=1 Tax=Geomonas subterranea TaxID=2847989 RepID=A0ABX8LIX7_9BACT|nr:Ig-like domain-containing protein [Geomonas subterranea]QXE91678.1 fibronectin type III domain-containing protein [Geomonas subterranea]